MPLTVHCPNQHRFTVQGDTSTQRVVSCPECSATVRLDDATVGHVAANERKSSTARGSHSIAPTVSRGHSPEHPSQDSSPSPAEEKDHRRIVGYELRKKLGEGGMGTVYLARQVAADRDVALKLLRSDRLAASGDSQAMERLRVEARAAARLDHDHIVPVYEVGDAGGLPFYSMRYVEGGSLQQQLRDGPLLPRQAAARLQPVARALHAAHREGVLHRDIKPANLLWDTRTERLMVADFGLAKLTADSRLTMAGEIFGSPAYMSPEQAQGKPVDARSDVYSLGATLYHALTGRPPFQGHNVPQTLRMVVENEPVRPRTLNSAIDRDLETICLKCLEKEPRRRYASAGALADDLRRYLEHRPVVARPIGPARRAARWCRRRPALASLLALAATISLSLAVYLQTRPAYLRLQVTPPDARVLLDGKPVRLEQGEALVRDDPGRHEVTVAAPRHESWTRPVVLARGRGNMSVLDVDLVPLLGRLRVTSDPPGARVRVVDERRQAVADGVTPFFSDSLPTGRYSVTIHKPLYQPLTLIADVPAGHRAKRLEGIELQPEMSGAKQYEVLRSLRQTLGKPLANSRTFQDQPLSAVAETLERLSGLPIDIDRRALREAGIAVDAPISGTLESGPRYERMKLLLRSHGLTLLPVPSGEEIRLELTTRDDKSEMVTVLYPVGELVSPLRQDWNPLIQNLRTAVAPGSWQPVGGSASVRPNRRLMALEIRHRWAAHLEVLEYLTELQRRHLEGASAGLVLETEDERAAAAAARDWLALIDAGDYEQSWKEADAHLRRTMPLDKWKTARQLTPHPTVRRQRRRLEQLQYLPQAPPGLGEAPAVMLRFRSAGADYDLYEVVVLVERDERWRAAGYQITQAPATPTVSPPRRQP